MSNQRISSKANSRARSSVSPRAARHPRQAHIRDRTAAPCRGAGGAAIRRSWRAAPRGCGFCRATCRPRPCAPSRSVPRHRPGKPRPGAYRSSSSVCRRTSHGYSPRGIYGCRNPLRPDPWHSSPNPRCHRLPTSGPHGRGTGRRAPSPTGRGADPGSRKDCPSPFRSNCASGSIRHKAPVPRSRKGIYRHS